MSKTTTRTVVTPLRTLFAGALLGAGGMVAVPAAVDGALTAYRDGGETRNVQMTVTQLYGGRPGLAPRVVTGIGIEYDIVNVPARGVTNADAIWRDMRVGCTYNITAFGYRTRELGVNPVLVSASHVPTPECPVLPPQRITS